MDAAFAELKRHCVIDADDYRGPKQATPAPPRHEHFGRAVPCIGKLTPGADMRAYRRKTYLAIRMLDNQSADGVIIGVHSWATRALGTCMSVRASGAGVSVPTAVRRGAPGWRYRRGQPVKAHDLIDRR